MPYKISAFGVSDIGLVRQNNEDYWAEDSESGFYALADGMGGHRAGEIASKAAVTSLCHHLKNAISEGIPSSLEEAKGVVTRVIEETNSTVYEMGRSSAEWRGMGTTLCCLYFHSEGLIFAHVGDSRIYRFRNRKLEQLTKDHSLLRELVEIGQLNEQQATDFLYKNIITKAIGTEPFVEPSVQSISIELEDIYFMCSDGLSDMLSLKEMEKVINGQQSVERIAKDLVKEAKSRGGYDNITIVIAKVNSRVA